MFLLLFLELMLVSLNFNCSLKVFCIIWSICAIWSLGWVPDVEDCMVPASAGVSCSSAWAVLLAGWTTPTWASLDCLVFLLWPPTLGVFLKTGILCCSISSFIVYLTSYRWMGCFWWNKLKYTDFVLLCWSWVNWHQDCVDYCNGEIIAVWVPGTGWLVQNSRNLMITR